MTARTQSKRQGRGPWRAVLRRALQGLLLLLAFTAGCYGSGRLSSAVRAVRILDIETPAPVPATSPTGEASVFKVPATSPTGEASVFKVAAFNIAHGRGGAFGASNWQRRSRDELRRHLDRIARQIRDSGAHIVVLNEVDFRAAWSSHLNQARYLAAEAGFPHLVEQSNYDISLPFFSFRFGNAILSRFPVDAAERIDLPPLSRFESLVAGNHDGALAVIETPAGRVAVAAVHLEVRSEQTRLRCARELSALSRRQALPLVALGDFNSTPSSFPGSHGGGGNALDFLLLEGGFRKDIALHPEPRFRTFPSSRPKVTIDWILGAGDVEVFASEVVASRLSDHLMVTASIRIP